MYRLSAFSEGVQLTFDADREIPAIVDISWSGDGCGDLGENTQTKQIENKEKNTVTTKTKAMADDVPAVKTLTLVKLVITRERLFMSEF